MRPRRSQQGIALVITLVMLSVVTLMAVTFLAISRRERAAVAVYSDQVDARDMADMALARAQVEVAARIQSATNLLNYDLLVSTNFIGGFRRADGTNIFNVGYTYRGTANLLDNEDDLLQNLGNLQVDPRAPVFVRLPNGRLDFRFFLNLNRNSNSLSLPVFDTNGFFVGLDLRNRPLPATNHWVGDPEWIGVLRRPDLPHSGTNPFIGRFAYLVLPTGKSLDVNFMHNMARSLNFADREGYLRNTGAGSWELNLAAFLRGLNSNRWNANSHAYRPDAARNLGLAFDHAFDILHRRYSGSPRSLASFTDLYGANAGRVIRGDGNDIYALGNLMQGLPRTNDVEVPTDPWSGDDSPATYEDPQELLTVVGNGPSGAPRDFSSWLGETHLFNSTYNRHTFYRLLGQLGTHSVPANRGRLHLNYDNRLDLRPDGLDLVPGPAVGFHATNFVFWEPLAFFTNAADLMVRASFHGLEPRSPLYGSTNLPYALTNLTATRIPVWPQNYYTPAVHRLFQLAANLYDATSGNPGLAGGTVSNLLQLPTVFRPVFQQGPVTNSLPNGNEQVTPNGIYISGWAVVTDDWQANVWNAPHVDLNQRGTPAVEARLSQGLGQGNLRVAGIPVVIGARRGFPNFNEFSLQTVATVGRKLEMVKRNAGEIRPSQTNQMYTLGVSNVFGVEFWNSYQTPYPRTLNLLVSLESDFVISNQTRLINLPSATNQVVLRQLFTGNAPAIPAQDWLGRGDPQGRDFQIPINSQDDARHASVVVPDLIFSVLGQQFLPPSGNQDFFEHVPRFDPPVWDLWITNRLRGVLVDTSAGSGGRIVDYVDLSGLNARLNITRALSRQPATDGRRSLASDLWATNRVAAAGGIPEGIQKQIQVSVAQLGVSETDWRNLQLQPGNPGERSTRIQRFAEFMGVTNRPAGGSTTRRMQAPFSPARRLFINRTWQVNDPLVHYLAADIADPARDPLGGPDGADDVEYVPQAGAAPQTQTEIGLVNSRYQPWTNSSSANPRDFDWAVKDPQIASSDDWEFPTNAVPNLGWIGRVHRGTPWQTVYLKSGRKADGTQLLGPRDWFQWSSHQPAVFANTTFAPSSTHPTNDWRLLELFTAAPNDNAARGLLGVNQDGLAAWSAVLGGVAVVTTVAGQTSVRTHLIRPGETNLLGIVDGINRTRTNRPSGRFNYLGEILATPELSDASPYLRLTSGIRGSPADAAMERIPQQILGLLNRDEPRVVIYGFGQSLKPAPDSAVVEPGRYFLMSTNYQITGEYATRAVVRFEGDPRAPRAVVESFQVMPPPE